MTTVPWLAFGTGTALYSSPATSQVLAALDAGIRHIDTAQAYRNEDSVGEALAKFLASTSITRDELFVTTKLAPQNYRPKNQSVKQSLQESLQRLKLDYVDLFLIHSPSGLSAGGLRKQWQEMEGVLEEGLAKKVGVSNFRVKDLEAVLDDSKVLPWINQIEFHPHLYADSAPILDFCKSKGIKIASYGGLTPVIPGRVRGSPLVPILESIATNSPPGTTPGQLVTKWALQKGVDIVVTTSSKPGRLLEVLKSKDISDLKDKDIVAIDDEAAKVKRRIWGM